jgi:hypothetical protein
VEGGLSDGRAAPSLAHELKLLWSGPIDCIKR